MKKFLSVVLIIAVITCLSIGLTGCNKMSASKLEEAIVGTWISPDIGEVTFNSDGSFSGTLPFEILIDIDGTYTVNSGDQIIVEFYHSDEFYDRLLDVEIEDDKLSVSYFLQSTSGVYTRKTDVNYEENYEEENYEYPEPEETTTQSLKFTAEMNEDGVYDLIHNNNGCSVYKVNYISNDRTEYDEGGHLFLYANENVAIPVFHKSEPAAIYFDTDEITFIKITSDVHYAPDVNFADSIYNDMLQYDDAPRSISGLGVYLYNFSNSDEIEINGENYDAFLDRRTVKFKEDYYVNNFFMLIDAEKGERFTIGGYEGTSWTEYYFYANVPFWFQDSYEKVSVPVEKTRNGYFTVDLSGLESGTYLNLTNKQLIEITD